MCANSPSPPIKHHYIPAFYLKRWTNKNGLLWEFRNPHKSKIVGTWKHPNATGYLNRGYELAGFPADQAQQVETNFFQPLDSWASRALHILENSDNKNEWDSRLRSAWSRFILSLLSRCPEDILTLKQTWNARFFADDPCSEKQYRELRTKGMPKTFAAYLLQEQNERLEIARFQAFFKLVNNEKVGSKINDMIWRVFNVPDNCPQLLTSDRPIHQSLGLLERRTYLTLPIGPKRLFVAAAHPETITKLFQTPRSTLVKTTNQHTVEAAVKYVYANDARQTKFVINRFGKNRKIRWSETLFKVEKM